MHRAPGIPCALCFGPNESCKTRAFSRRRDREGVFEIANQYFAVIASGAKQSIFDLAMPSHGLLRSARNDKRNLAPLAGRGRRRREAKSPGEGDYPRVRTCRGSPSPARKMLATSPRKRGEVKNGNAEPWIARRACHRARVPRPVASRRKRGADPPPRTLTRRRASRT